MKTAELPPSIQNLEQLEDLLSGPTSGVLETVSRLQGDVIVLGVAGKMGPSLSRMIKRASDQAGAKRKVIGVARFSSGSVEGQLRKWGIDTIRADLLNENELHKLPDAPNIVYMAGMKFGSTGNESLTWAMNTYLPGMVCEKYRRSKIVAFSTGNVYGLTPLTRGAPSETDPLNPLGDYAMSCLGRERIFDHFSRAMKIPVSLIRLNYAVEMRYGVLVDMARKVFEGQTVDVSMGNVNVIWQRDANAMSIQSFDHAASPAWVINVAGPETMNVRRVCEEYGRIFKKEPKFTGVEAPDALVSSGVLAHRIFGYPTVTAGQMIPVIADWIARGGESLGKPTHFDARDGKF